MKFLAVMLLGLALCSPGSGEYVKNPNAPDLTDCGKYWYYKDCKP